MFQLCHVFFPLSCWLCPPRLSCALVHSIHVRVSLPSTPLPGPSHATCSFHSSCWLCPPGLSCVLVHSILVKCRVSLLTPVYTFAMSQSYHVFFPLSCWPCSARLSFALVHSTLVKCRVSLLTPVYTFAMSQSCHVFFPLQLLALFSQTRSCALVHSTLVTCRVSLLTPVYTFAMSQSYHVFFPLQLLALFSQTVLCSNLSRPADGICAPPCRLCLVPLFSRRDDSGPSPVGRVMERECQTMGTRDEQLACY